MREEIWGIAKAISALRQELLDAMNEFDQQILTFSVKPVELTLQTVLTKGADGRVGWHVLGLGAKSESAKTHSLRLQLEPLLRTPEGGYTSDFTVADIVDQKPNFGQQPE